jgi:putative ABC transport system permease protein
MLTLKKITYMLQNYIKIARRNLRQNKLHSFINVSGLAIGLATCMLIMLYVWHEWSFDRFNKKSDRIVRVYFEGKVQGKTMKESSVMAPVAATMVADFGEVEQATRVRYSGEMAKVICQNNTFKKQNFTFVDANFFDVFTLPFLKGDKATALTMPHSVVLSETTAKKYFGNNEPLGAFIKVNDDETPYKITGVIRDIPDNSHFQFDLLASLAGNAEAAEGNWMSSNFHTYLVLKPGVDYKNLEAKLPQMVEKHIGPQMKQGLGQTLEEFRKSGNDIGFHLQPLTDIHLYTDFTDNFSTQGDAQTVYIFGVIAVFMLLIACINFMNLSTASASKRAKEVGIRKVMGSFKTELAKQFLSESVLVASLSLIVAVVLVKLTLPVFNQFMGQNLNFQPIQQPLLLAGLAGLALLTGLLAGIYPAFYLSSFVPSAVLKGQMIKSKGGAFMRNGLVVFQFFISIVLIISTGVVYNQLSYIQNKDLGYDKNRVLVLSNVWQLGNSMDAFRAQLESDARIEQVSCSSYLPAGPSGNNNFFVTSGKMPDEIVKTLRYDVDEKYLTTLGIDLKAGRNFSAEFGTDKNAVIINEAASKALGFGENALNETIIKNLKSGEKETYSVIGVVKDFHFRSLHEHISPLVMVLAPDKGQLIVKVKAENPAQVVADIQQRFATFGPGDPLDYSFLDERHNNTYKAEQKIGLTLMLFTGLTIFVACLGLFGLVTFMANARTKEIGIRKVLGASVAGITGLLAKDFLKLVVIAIVIASPIAYYFMQKWLSDFAYRIDIQWWMFAGAGVAAVLIAFLTVGFQSVRAALANPVKSLRSE